MNTNEDLIARYLAQGGTITLLPAGKPHKEGHRSKPCQWAYAKALLRGPKKPKRNARKNRGASR